VSDTALALAGQTAVVTGASSGVGRAVALALGAKGARVCLAGRRVEALDDVAGQVARTAPRPLVHRADLSRDAEIADLISRVRDELGAVDVLVHAAGIISLGRLDRAPAEDFDRQFRINVRAAYVLTQGLLPMLQASRGQVVFLNSSAGLSGRAGSSQYAATKHALRAMADSLREEVNADGVRVLSVYLGRTATPMQAAIHKAEGKDYTPERLIRPEDVASVVATILALPRSVEVTEIVLRPLQKPMERKQE
jgi:NADP-dependent 3-hydroxy acid dehydrogenase YdfG